MNKIRVLLVDDHHVLRDGLKVLLDAEDDILVIGEANNGQEAFDLTLNLNPDVVVMDLGLPDFSGFEAIKLIRERKHPVRIVVLSMHTRKEFVVRAIEAGADGYVPKSSTHVSLLDAIRTVQSGERYLHPKAATALVETYMEDMNSDEIRYQELTAREQEVFQLTAMGFTSREIGEKLVISPKTVDTYRQRAVDKLGIEHRSELVRFALKIGILDDLQGQTKN
jgi:two-component system response regulator NreC